ncbi:Hypothetical protein POVR1_LOCUS415 [uncultured virus]|nr:Hypothetical protein POVR1_LOCUS415 [uncultured virus]
MHGNFLIARAMIEKFEDQLSPHILVDLLDEAAWSGRPKTVEYLLAKPQMMDLIKQRGSRAMKRCCDGENRPFWLDRNQSEEYYQFHLERKEIFNLLVRHSYYDDQLPEIASDGLLFYARNPSDYEGRERLQELTTQWVRLVIHRLDVPITIDTIKNASRYDNEEVMTRKLVTIICSQANIS